MSLNRGLHHLILPAAISFSCSLVIPAHAEADHCSATFACVESASVKSGLVQLVFTGNVSSAFHAAWLWDNAPGSFYPSGDRSRTLEMMPKTVIISDASASNCRLQVVWAEGYPSARKDTFEACFLYDNRYDTGTLTAPSAMRRSPVLRQGDRIPTVNFDQVLMNNSALLELLGGIKEFGMAVIQGVPDQLGSVLRVAARVGPPSHESLYGKTFQVRAVQDFANVAYSNHGVPLHQDLAYYESPPGLQWLHCLLNEAEGGENRFVDAIAAAEEFRVRQPRNFETLVRVPATFHKKRFLDSEIENARASWMERSRAHIELGADHEVKNVFWSPPWAGQLRVPPGDVEPYYVAASAFARMLELDDDFAEFRVQMRPQPGSIIVWNNQRVLHGRKAFSSQRGKGARHLEGTYTNIDDFIGKYHVLQAQSETGVLIS